MSREVESLDRQRLNYIDVCKALGIILVVLGHTHTIPDELYLIIYSFHMPLFFIIAGFVYNRANNKSAFHSYLMKKIKQYLLPYFVFSIINLAIEVLWRLLITKQNVNGDYFFIKIRGIFFCYSDIENMPNCSPVWFLMCLFVASILFWWIMKLPLRFSWIPALLGTLINYFVLPYCKNHTSFPWKFPTFFLAVTFMYVGFILKLFISKSNTIITKKLPVIVFSILLILSSFAVVVFTDNKVGMNENTYGNYLIFIITSIAISCSFILLVSKMNFLENSFILWLGRNTLCFIGFNYVCRDIATEIYYYIPVVKNYAIHWSVSFLMTFALCVLVSWIWYKIKNINLIQKAVI